MNALNFGDELASLHDTLRAFTRRFTRDHEESMDLVQDTILKALTYSDKFRQNTNLKGWLFTIMRNTFINNVRRGKNTDVSHQIQDLAYLQVADRHTFNSPDGLFEYEDIWRNVHEIDDELLVPFKMYASGYKYNEIAEHLHIPLGTVKNRIFHARKEIQKKLMGN